MGFCWKPSGSVTVSLATLSALPPSSFVAVSVQACGTGLRVVAAKACVLGVVRKRSVRRNIFTSFFVQRKRFFIGCSSHHKAKKGKCRQDRKKTATQETKNVLFFHQFNPVVFVIIL